MQKTLDGRDISDDEWQRSLKINEEQQKLADAKLKNAKDNFKKQHPVDLPKQFIDPSDQVKL